MQIQVNHDNHLRITAETSERLSSSVEQYFAQYADWITRVEIHLADLNGGKHGESDKRCTLEARLSGMKPMAVSHEAESLQLAIDGALEKLDHALGHAVGKLRAG